MTSVDLDGVTFSYHRSDTPALSSITLAVRPGEILCLVGPSGCGKTTLLKIVSGLLQPQRGAVRFDGKKVTAVPPERRNAALVFQGHMLFPFMTVLENVGFGLRMRSIDAEERAHRARAMLEKVHLEGYDERRPSNLSSGQQQRVALARALVTEPAVLLLDEPLSNLDRHLREDMRQVILQLQREIQVTTLCVTHDQEEAVLLGDRIAMLSAGELLQVGSAEEFYERPVSVAVARFFGNHNYLEGSVADGLFTSREGRFRIVCEPEQSGVTGGRACLHIRPEAILLAEPGSTSAQNVVLGAVTHRVFVGTHVRYTVDVDGHPWQVVSGPAQSSFAEGDRVGLHLPPERIWLTRE